MQKPYYFCFSLLFVATTGIVLTPLCLSGKSTKSPAPVTQPTTTTSQIKLDGVEYEVLKEAPLQATSPIKSQSVSVHYTGWLNNHGKLGKKFDSSVDRNQPFVFLLGLSQVIAGWDKMVAHMKVGQKVRVYIPAALAYGSRGAGALIPKSADLIFDIELLKIN